jgi:hypothetical protein
MYYLEKENNSFLCCFTKFVLIRRRLYYVRLQNDCFRQQSRVISNSRSCSSSRASRGTAFTTAHPLKAETERLIDRRRSHFNEQLSMSNEQWIPDSLFIVHGAILPVFLRYQLLTGAKIGVTSCRT